MDQVQRGNACGELDRVDVGIDPVRRLRVVRSRRLVGDGGQPQVASLEDRPYDSTDIRPGCAAALSCNHSVSSSYRRNRSKAYVTSATLATSARPTSSATITSVSSAMIGSPSPG